MKIHTSINLDKIFLSTLSYTARKQTDLACFPNKLFKQKRETKIWFTAPNFQAMLCYKMNPCQVPLSNLSNIFPLLLKN